MFGITVVSINAMQTSSREDTREELKSAWGTYQLCEFSSGHLSQKECKDALKHFKIIKNQFSSEEVERLKTEVYTEEALRVTWLKLRSLKKRIESDKLDKYNNNAILFVREYGTTQAIFSALEKQLPAEKVQQIINEKNKLKENPAKKDM